MRGLHTPVGSSSSDANLHQTQTFHPLFSSSRSTIPAGPLVSGRTSSALSMTAVEDYLLSLPDSHPLQVAIRTYTLALSLSLGPALLSFISSKKIRLSDSKTVLHTLKKILRREFGLTGFPFAITVAVAGGAVLQALWRRFEEFDLDSLPSPGSPSSISQASGSTSASGRSESRNKTFFARLTRLKSYLSSLPPIHKAFLLNALPCLLSILLMQSRHRSSHTRKASIPWTVPISPPTKSEGRTSATLDLTLMFLVRAVDAVVQRVVFRRSGGDEESSPREGEERKRWRQRVTMRIDAMLFWASSARSVYVATHILPRTLASSKCMYSAYLCSLPIKNHVVLLL